MPRKKDRQPRPFSELNPLWQAAGLPVLPEATLEALHGIDLPTGLQAFMEFLKGEKITPKRPEDMYCFIMYDVENNKIRRLMAKYLEQKGCLRVQKSVFFARLHRKVQKEVIDMLRRMNACYDNQDSILILPVGEDMLNSLTCVGKEFELQLLTAPKHTLFF
jgi:CRISPR-associated protein Cas2